MAIAEDAATILDEFVHEVANLPAEIQHLLEEIQAKDELIQGFRLQINQKDQSLQRHVKQHGGHVKHPKEEQIVKAVLANYDKAQALQDEKTALAERACILLDRHVRRLDIKIERLPDSSLFEDRLLPSLLRASSANLVEAASAGRSGIATPVGSFGLGHAGAGIANAAMARMASMNAHANRGVPQAPMAGMQQHPLLGTQAVQRARESSAGAVEKRRKLQLQTLPLPSSNLATSNLARSSSAGPGTPKAGTPVSRAGSAGPRIKKSMKRMPDPLRKKVIKTGLSKKAARRLKNANRNSPSTTGGDSSDDSGSEEENGSQSQANEGNEDEDMADEPYEDEGEDNNPYCICRKPSHGDMIACDNAKCHYEWFHYECVGLKEEPKGKWLCPDCRRLPPNQLKIAK